MITIKAKYNERKELTSTEKKIHKACSAEALAIICDMYELILKNTEGMTKLKLDKLIKESLKEEK